MSELRKSSFFARMRSGAASGTPTGRAETLKSSIVSHLRVLLNTAQGASETVPNYGIIDFADLMLEVPDSLRVIERELKNAIVRFEPRLTRVSVRSVLAEDERLAFEVRARMRFDASDVCFATSIAPGGKIQVVS